MMKPSKSKHDVRMRGFVERTTVADALLWVDQQTSVLPAETIDLEQAFGRVVATDIESKIDVPPFDRSAMDGYALHGAETEGAGDYNPLSFKLLGESMPGAPFEGDVTEGTAIRIMTGAPIPSGADAVVPAEYASETDGRVELTTSVSPGKHVGKQGEDVTTGRCLFETGRRLRPQDVGLLASVGVDELRVIRRPRVRLIITGNELAEPGRPRGPYQIFDSNSVVLRGLVARDGGVLESQRHIEDDRPSIQKAMSDGGADVILVSGGSSVGKEDHAPCILREVGELPIHGVTMRPSSPTGMGRAGGSLVFLLPGNPVSCLCAYDFFAGRAIRLLGGLPAKWPYRKHSLKVGKKIVSAIGRVDYCRVQIVDNSVEPLAVSGASILSSTTRADGFVVVPSESEGYAPGGVVDVFHYETFS